MNRDQKAAVVDEIADQIRGAAAIFAVDYRGLSVVQAADLRAKLRESDTRFRIVKNSLTERAADKAGAESLKALLDGPTALALVQGDAAVAARALSDTARTLRILEFKGGILDGAPLSADEVRSIARLPARDVLHAQLVGTIAAPLTGLARGLNALIAGIAIQLKAIADQGLVSGEPPTADEAPAEPTSGPEAPAAEAPTGEELAAPAAEGSAEAAPETPAPETPAPETPAPETPAPETPAPEALGAGAGEGAGGVEVEAAPDSEDPVETESQAAHAGPVGDQPAAAADSATAEDQPGPAADGAPMEDEPARAVETAQAGAAVLPASEGAPAEPAPEASATEIAPDPVASEPDTRPDAQQTDEPDQDSATDTAPSDV
jgi:large subunit ribosomal protein L10